MATNPIDYSIDTGNPAQSAFQGYLQGTQIGLLQQKQAQEAQQQQAAAAAQAQMQADLSSVASNPNASGSDYANLMTRYPQLAENLKRSWDVLNGQQRQTKLDQASQIYAALQSGKPDVAKNLISGFADAAGNSGDARTQAGLQAIAKQIDMNPDAAKASIGMTLVSQAGPDKFAEAFGKLGAEQRAQELAPSELKQKQAEATIKTEEAATAHQKFLNDLEAQGWNIKKVQEEINASREGTRLKAMQVAMEKELQPLKKQELQVKIDEANQKLGDQMREKVAAAQGAAAAIDNLSNTVDRILKNPALDSVVGSIQGRLPSIASDQGADAIALIDQLGSQAFIAQIPQMKGTGSLSEKEGDKLQASLQNLSRTQSESQIRYNLQEVQRLMAKARENLSKKTGVPLSAPDRPNAPVRAESAGPATSGAPANQQRNVVVDF